MTDQEIDPALLNSRRNRTDLTSDCPNVAELVERIFEEFNAYRVEKGGRAVTKNHRETYRQHLELIILDLLSACEGDPTKYIGYSRGSGNFRRGGAYWNFQTDTPLISEDVYKGLIDFLWQVGYVENHVAESGYTDFSSRMRALPRFIECFRELRLNWTCIQYRQNHPSIIVKDENKQIIPWPDPERFDVVSAVTNLNRINANLQGTHINLNITDDAFVDLQDRLRGYNTDGDDQDGRPDYREPFEYSNRRLRRIFGLGKFSIGGRFYGGWWQGIPSEYRKHIEIDGYATVEIDFATMQARTFYAWENLEPPEDSYALPGWDAEFRPLIKKAFNQITNCHPRTADERKWGRLLGPDLTPDPKPDNWGELEPHQRVFIQRQLFRAATGRDYSDLIRGLLELHEPIRKWFFQKNWGAVQSVDSAIAEKIMINLLDKPSPVTALPIHDSFIVPYKDKDVLFETMQSVFEEIQGQKCKVDTDITVFDPPEGFDPNTPPFPLISAEERERYASDRATERMRYFESQLQWFKYKSDRGEPVPSYHDGRIIPDPRYWLHEHPAKSSKLDAIVAEFRSNRLDG